MCNEYAREQTLEEMARAFGEVEVLPPFEWSDGRLPNDTEAKSSIRISDAAPVVRLAGDRLTGAMTTWAWRAPNGRPVFNFQSEGRDFSHSDRVLVPATGFYEYTAPAAPKVKLKDRHIFTLKGEPWFWIAGIARDGAFTLLTAEPGADVAPYHDRSIITLAPAAGLDWLTLSRPAADILKAPPAGRLAVRTLRRDGVDLAS
ncbi:MAG TPA: SOS response-associated peptidase family protein [Phenylobacterium sp.]|nr:SOS response-associated peptidase family protein [Phenylobacterium sp.]